MNENLDLVEILKDCPKGTKLYSPIFGVVEFDCVKGDVYPIRVLLKSGLAGSFTLDGRTYKDYKGECMLFPSKEQRDWSKFKPNQPKFDPKTLKPFDKVLVRNSNEYPWGCSFYSDMRENERSMVKYATVSYAFEYCIPYNKDTKHLVGTTDEAPEYYRHWED